MNYIRMSRRPNSTCVSNLYASMVQGL